ncbi:MAG: hypothetical protein F6K24_10550 [Okeania sp. SIO2D1]|nr:hypothetical protein [Okeania sp. SIO2D1]
MASAFLELYLKSQNYNVGVLFGKWNESDRKTYVVKTVTLLNGIGKEKSDRKNTKSNNL